jgi:hypothetical protein
MPSVAKLVKHETAGPFFVVIVLFVVRGGKPADVLLAVVSAISIDVVTLSSIPIQLVSVSQEAH